MNEARPRRAQLAVSRPPRPAPARGAQHRNSLRGGAAVSEAKAKEDNLLIKQGSASLQLRACCPSSLVHISLSHGGVIRQTRALCAIISKLRARGRLLPAEVRSAATFGLQRAAPSRAT
eukprot:2465673-Prymnesium_polylepis.1